MTTRYEEIEVVDGHLQGKRIELSRKRRKKANHELSTVWRTVPERYAAGLTNHVLALRPVPNYVDAVVRK